jgi:molecular chaperone GrpE
MSADRDSRTGGPATDRPKADGPSAQSDRASPEGAEATSSSAKSDSDEGAQPGDLASELASAKERLMRALAEQENVRRRAQRDREEAVRYANADLARDLLPIIDNLTRALDSLPEEDVADESMLQLLRGVAAIERQMLQALERYGVQRFDPIGEPFDPHYHQAVFQNPTADQPEGTVTEVLQPGYRHHDRLLRPAMVGVAGAGDANPPPQDEQSGARHERRH